MSKEARLRNIFTTFYPLVATLSYPFSRRYESRSSPTTSTARLYVRALVHFLFTTAVPSYTYTHTYNNQQSSKRKRPNSTPNRISSYIAYQKKKKKQFETSLTEDSHRIKARPCNRAHLVRRRSTLTLAFTTLDGPFMASLYIPPESRVSHTLQTRPSCYRLFPRNGRWYKVDVC